MVDSSVLFIQDGLSSKYGKYLAGFAAIYGVARIRDQSIRDTSIQLFKISTIPIAAYNLYGAYKYTKDVEGADLIQNNVHNYSNMYKLKY